VPESLDKTGRAVALCEEDLRSINGLAEAGGGIANHDSPVNRSKHLEIVGGVARYDQMIERNFETPCEIHGS
jgi:hypothetical protein